MSNKERIHFIDYLKAFSIMLVIITHYDWPDKHGYIFTMLINMAVPVFLIVSGYNYAMSYQRKTDGSLKEMYNPKLLLQKVERFMSPFIVIVFVEWVLLMVTGEEFSYYKLLLLGGIGPGSYYVPLMIQLIGLFPLIYIIVDNHPVIGLISAGIVNMLYEMWVVWSGIEKVAYRLSIGRYILLIALGCYLYVYHKRKLKWWQLALMFAFGMYCQIDILHNRRDVGLFYYWRPTAVFIAFYIFPIIVILFRIFYHSHIKGFVGDLLTLISKGSYHIFLVQMVYYHFKLGGMIMDKAWYIAIPYNIVITVAVGIAFYELEKYIRNQIRTRRK